MSKISEHTPGPWTVREVKDSWLGGTVWRVETLDGSVEITREADARLISAAPDLLESCKTLVEILRMRLPVTEEDVHVAELAIKKAEGR